MHIQQVADQGNQALSVLVRDVEHGALLFAHLTHHPRHQQAQRATNRGQRGSQLVAHRGHELVLEPLDAPAFTDVGGHHHAAEHLPRDSPDAVSPHQHWDAVTLEMLHLAFTEINVGFGQGADDFRTQFARAEPT